MQVLHLKVYMYDSKRSLQKFKFNPSKQHVLVIMLFFFTVTIMPIYNKW